MTGTLTEDWSLMWREVWHKLAETSQAPPDLFIQLFNTATEYLAAPPTGADYDPIHNDPLKARRAFQKLKGRDFKGEAAIIGFLEAAHATIGEFSMVPLSKRYVTNIARFLVRYNLRYRVVEPFKFRLLLAGTFAGLYSELERLNAVDPNVAQLMEDFEHSFDSYVRSQRQGDIKICISKAAMYAEGMASLAANSHGSLGDLCDRLNCWPHGAVKRAVKAAYGFCSDYPGVRHGNAGSGKIRELEGRDAIFLSLLFLSLSGYVTESIDTREVLGQPPNQ
jgi:hypothetical protein